MQGIYGVRIWGFKCFSFWPASNTSLSPAGSCASFTRITFAAKECASFLFFACRSWYSYLEVFGEIMPYINILSSWCFGVFCLNSLICIIIYSDRRLADHFGGKLHLGYMQIREKLAELQVRQTSLMHFWLCLGFLKCFIFQLAEMYFFYMEKNVRIFLFGCKLQRYS